MALPLAHVHALTDFLRNHKTHIAQISRARSAHAFTVNGTPKVVMMSPRTFERLSALADQMETLLTVQESLDDIERGAGLSLEQLAQRIHDKHGIQRRGRSSGRT